LPTGEAPRCQRQAACLLLRLPQLLLMMLSSRLLLLVVDVTCTCST
jgi:hypothetical protein